MGVKVISERIRSVGIWVGLPIEVWIVAEPDGVTLVDTGLSMMARAIVQEIDRMNAGPLKRIVLTHGHADHVGGLKRILAQRPVPVYIHEREIPYAEGDLAYPGKSQARAHVEKGILQPLPAAPKHGPARIGELDAYFTPGHSPGHVVYWHGADKVLLAGDLFNAKRGRLIPPRFTPDPELALQSAGVLRDFDPERMQVCHGGTIYRPAGQLDDLEREAEASKLAQARLQEMRDKRNSKKSRR